MHRRRGLHPSYFHNFWCPRTHIILCPVAPEKQDSIIRILCMYFRNTLHLIAFLTPFRSRNCIQPESWYTFVYFYVLVVFIYTAENRVWNFVLQFRIVVNWEVERGERWYPSNKPALRVVWDHHTSQVVIFQTESEPRSFHMRKKCPSGTHNGQELLIRSRVPFICISKKIGPKTQCGPRVPGLIVFMQK